MVGNINGEISIWKFNKNVFINIKMETKNTIFHNSDMMYHAQVWCLQRQKSPTTATEKYK